MKCRKLITRFPFVSIFYEYFIPKGIILLWLQFPLYKKKNGWDADGGTQDIFKTFSIKCKGWTGYKTPLLTCVPNCSRIPLKTAAAATINRMWAAELQGFPLLHYTHCLLYTGRSYSLRINYKTYITLLLLLLRNFIRIVRMCHFGPFKLGHGKKSKSFHITACWV